MIKRRAFSLLDQLRIDDVELLRYAFSFLKPEHQKLLKKAYGNSLLENYQSCNLTKEERKNSLNSAILSLKNRIKNTKVITVTIYPERVSFDSNYFFEKFGCYYPKDVLKVFNQLDTFSKEVFYKVHGPFLLESNCLMLTSDEQKIYEQGLLMLQSKLSSYPIVSQKGPTQYVLQYLYSPKKRGPKPKNLLKLNSNYTFQKISKAVSKLPISDQQLLKKAYGDNYDSVSGCSSLDEKEKAHLSWIIRGPLKNYLDNPIDHSSIYHVNNIFKLYPNYSKNKVLRGINLLSTNSIMLLKKAYGIDYSDDHLEDLTNEELLLLENIQNIELKEILKNGVNNMTNKKNNSVGRNRISNPSNFSSSLSDDFIHDRLTNLPYQRMTQQEESDYIKKAKLSYYYETEDLEIRDKYLEYYKEMFPKFSEEYDQADFSEKEKLLEEAIQNSLHYRNAFINNNLRLVFSIAKRYTSFDDLENIFQEGILGMMKALEKFDVSLGLRFSTYATWWIRQNISRYIAEKTSILRIPVYKNEQLSILARIEDRLTSELGHKPKKEDLAEAMDLPLEKIEELMDIKAKTRFTSLDEPVNNGDGDDDTTIGDFVEDDDNLIEETDKHFLKTELLKLLNSINISTRDKKILLMRFGFYNNRIYTLEEIGNEVGVTRERIRQIEVHALKKLRNNVKVVSLYHDYFGDESKGSIQYINRRVSNGDDVLRKSSSVVSDKLFFSPTSTKEDIIREIFIRCDENLFNDVQLDILKNRYVYGLSPIGTARIVGISLDSVEKIEEECVEKLYEQITDVELTSGDTGRVKSLRLKK